jgi:hypothetical protein
VTRTAVRLMLGGAALVAAGCRSSDQISDVPFGRPVPTRLGNVVTLEAWRPAANPVAADHPPGLALKSCRTRSKGLLLDASGFALRTARGAVLHPSGSNLTAVGPDCLEGELAFQIPAGDHPRFATYRAGYTLLRWRIPPPPSPARS